MPHLIYTGSFAALEARWMEVIAELQQNDPLLEINVLIGSNILASYLKRRLAADGQAAANIRFHTFLDLVNRLAAAEEKASAKPRLPRLGASIILEEILAKHSPDIFAPLSRYRGFRDALLDTFRDLRDGGISAENLAGIIQTGRRTRDRRRQLLGLTDLFRRFRERISLFRDVDDDFNAAFLNAAFLNTSREKQHLNVGKLLIYGIYDCTGQQSGLLGALKDSVEMIYFIPYIHETVSDFARPFLEARVDELGVKPKEVEDALPGSGLDHLAARRFGFLRASNQEERVDQDGSFALVSVPGESRAAVEVVREIFRAVQDKTISGFYQAAVILRQPENDIPILAEMLRLHGVPYFIHGGGRFSERPFGRAVMAVSGLESNSFSRDEILSAMELIAAAQPESSAWNVQSWRALTNDPSFLAGVESWDTATEALVERARKDVNRAEKDPDSLPDDESELDGPSIQKARSRLESAQSLRDAWVLLLQAAAGWPASRSWQDWADFLERRFHPLLGLSGDWAYFSTVLDEIGSLQALNGLEVQDSEFNRTSGVSSDRLRSALLESVSSLSCPIGRFQRSGVNLLSTSAARGLRFPLVIIPGLDEGRFPAKLRQDPLLLDSERLRMKGLSLKSKRVEEERLLFDMAARSAEKRLVLITSRLDESSDHESIPSQFFLRVAAAVKGKIISIRDLTPGTISGFRSVSLDNPAPVENEIPIDEGEIRLRLITAGKGTARRVLESLSQSEPFRLKRSLAYDRCRWVPRLTPFDAHLRDSELIRWMADKLGASAGQVSASRLEEYVKCPYLFFLKRGMELEAWEEPDQFEGINPLERGRVVHSILERFLERYHGEKLLEASEEELRDSLESLAVNSLERSHPKAIPDLLWEIERDALIAMLKNWLRFEKERAKDGMLPSQVEQVFGEFGPDEQYPIFRLQAGKHTFGFRGRIDRVDISPNGRSARVVDYKTGVLPGSMKSKKRTPLMSGERIQVSVYGGALSVLDGYEDLETVEGEYLHLQPRDGRIMPCTFTDEEMREALSALPGILEIIGDGIESGVFFARTSGAVWPLGHCDYCDFLPICGKDRMQREERKANDAAVKKFLQIVRAGFSRHGA